MTINDETMIMKIDNDNNNDNNDDINDEILILMILLK